MKENVIAINEEEDEEEEDEDTFTDESGFDSLTEKYKKKKRNTRCVKLRECLRFVSVGKYDMKLYHRGSDELSSSFGGAITILVIVIVVYFATETILQVLSKNEYSMI